MSAAPSEQAFFPRRPACSSSRHTKKQSAGDGRAAEQGFLEIVRVTPRKPAQPVVPPAESYPDYVKLSPPKELMRFRRRTTKLSRPVAKFPNLDQDDETRIAVNRKLMQTTEEFEFLMKDRPVITDEDNEVAAICANLKHRFAYDL
jgi:hypothetical protein